MKTYITTLLISSLLTVLNAAEPQLMLEFKLLTVPAQVKLPDTLQRMSAVSLVELRNFLQTKDVGMMSAPTLVALAGQDAEIYVGQEAIQYMEKAGDHFTLKQLEKDVGLRIKVNGSLAKQVNELSLDCSVTISLLDGREPLPGVHLEVGKPIITDHSLSMTATLKDGTWYVLDVLNIQPATQQQADALYILCKATRLNSQGKPAVLPLEIDADQVKVNPDGTSVYTGNVRIEHEDKIMLADQITLREQALKGEQKMQIISQSMTLDPETGSTTFMDATLILKGVKLEADRLTIQAKEQNKATSKLEKKLKALILPTLQFQDVSIDDAVMFLALQSRQLDPEKKGVNIILTAKAQRDATITLSLKQVPLMDALRYVAELAGLNIKIEEEAILITER